ncbi:MAG: hypothetical protein NUV54_03185 [Candidatus Taylorbacteria bacterium]|nr:hypothetical protein [Candidatus Taylorbacteria bacterium]
MSWLLDEIGFKRLTDEEQKYLEDVAADTILNRIIKRVASRFDNERLDSIRHLFKEGSEMELEGFLQSHKLSLEDLIDQELKGYREEMLEAKNMLTGVNG